MAFGPHCADNVQRYILQTISRNEATKIDFDTITDPSQQFNGQEEWSVGEVFDDEVLRTFEQPEIEIEGPAIGFRALDQVYDALETTHNGNKKLEGLRAIDIGWDVPFGEDSKTWWKWRKGYREAGLIDDNDELTPEGDIFLQTDPRGYDLDNVSIEDVGQVYNALVTSGYKDNPEHNGRKIEALFLYGGGLNHKQVSNEAGIDEGTLRYTTDQLKDVGILTDDYMLTPEGYEFGQMVLDQIGQLRAVTEQRLEDNFSYSQEALEGFEGNPYMAESLLEVSDNDF